MSISVKNITLSIDGTQSNKFKIELSGAQYNLNNFKLVQRLDEPNVLTFDLVKDPLEDISEPQFTVCADIIGKPVTLNLQTDSIETEIAKWAQGAQVADLEFDGVVTGTSATRDSSQYVVHVEAKTWDTLLQDHPNCKSYEDKTLTDIVQDVLDGIPNLNPKILTRHSNKIEYTVQYNETNYDFLKRLAHRYGEWFFNDGTILLFGQIGEPEPVVLGYPSKDVPEYSVKMKMRHVDFKQVASSYHAFDSTVKEGKDESEKEMNTLNNKVYEASVNNFVKPTLEQLNMGGIAGEDSRQTMLDMAAKSQARSNRAQMLEYTGVTYCSNLKLGSKLVIKDNYIASASDNGKSDVQQDEILITELIHEFDVEEHYKNTFKGLPSGCDYPPTNSSNSSPKCLPSRGNVKDNEDPENLGRIRVQFDWQKQQDESMMTPWLRIQPYGGKDKGFLFIPEIDEEVMVGFEGDNAERPYIMGNYFNGVDSPDELWLPGENEVKAIRTKNGHTIEFHDKGKGGFIRIYDNKKNNYSLTFSTDGKLIKLQSSGNIELSAAKDIVIQAGNDFKLTTGAAMTNIVGQSFHMEVVPAQAITPPEPIMSTYEEPVCSMPPAPTTTPAMFQLDLANGKMTMKTKEVTEEVDNSIDIKTKELLHTANVHYKLTNGSSSIEMAGSNASLSAGAELFLQATTNMTISAMGTMNMGAMTILMN